MQNKDNLLMKANYVLYKATDMLLAIILGEYYNKDVSVFLDVFGKIKKECHKDIPDILRSYDGTYKNQIQIREWHNLVPDVLRNEMALLISGTTVTPTFKANYLAMGDDSTPPTNADTILWNETIRGLFSDRFSIDNVAYLDKFWSSAEVGGNSYQEIGVIVDGSGTANTGYLLSHILINETMGVNETLTVNVTITIG